jgi:large subunit ribosomal protein L7e
MTAINDPKKYKDLPLVPETILKKRHDLDDLRRKRAAAQLDQTRNQKKTKKGFYVKKLETFIAQGKSRRNTEIRYKRVLKKGMQKRASNKPIMETKEIETQVDSDDEEEAKVKTITYQANSVGAPMVFVIRIRDHHGASTMVRRALDRLRLKNLNEGIFIRYDDSNRKLLHLVEPWVVYGPPTKGVVEDLIERRGYGKVDDKRVALSDNTIIEQALGKECGVICAEDLVHELCEVGDNFETVANFLWPFSLSHKSSHFERETLRFTLGKDYGDKGERINEFIKAML